ncbi:MAG: DUF4834 family protein [Rikenellaceae bacterium]
MFDFIKNNIFLWIFIFLLVVAPSFLFGAMQIFGIIILALFAIMMIGGYLLRRKIAKMASQQGQNPFGAQGGENPFGGKPSGDPKVKIYKTEPSSATEKKVSDKVGDYVDFEEIKE